MTVLVRPQLNAIPQRVQRIDVEHAQALNELRPKEEACVVLQAEQRR